MATSGVASLRAAAEGREAKERHENSGVAYDPEFIPADFAALSGDWKWLSEIVGPALANGPGPLIDDDLAYVRPWGFEPEQVAAPTLLLHGRRRDRVVPCSHLGPDVGPVRRKRTRGGIRTPVKTPPWWHLSPDLPKPRQLRRKFHP